MPSNEIIMKCCCIIFSPSFQYAIQRSAHYIDYYSMFKYFFFKKVDFGFSLNIMENFTSQYTQSNRELSKRVRKGAGLFKVLVHFT